eukprot:4728552-Amphidinium_carterae.1
MGTSTILILDSSIARSLSCCVTSPGKITMRDLSLVMGRSLSTSERVAIRSQLNCHKVTVAQEHPSELGRWLLCTPTSHLAPQWWRPIEGGLDPWRLLERGGLLRRRPEW